jgi:nucleotide-binding universal stress UspA family protein
VTTQRHAPGRIVVGVDGSGGSETALRWAIAQARQTGDGIEAVASWQDPAAYGYSLGWDPVFSGDDSWAGITHRYLVGSVEACVDDLEPRVAITTRVVEGHPAQVLLEASAGARLLVVGSRGHGRLPGLLLGSVSQHCVQHAPCPVVVVPRDPSFRS